MNYSNLDHFMAVSYLYFLMTDSDAASISQDELEDLIIAIYDRNETTEEAQYLV